MDFSDNAKENQFKEEEKKKIKKNRYPAKKKKGRVPHSYLIPVFMCIRI